MSIGEFWPWIVLALLGAYHGINPGMGWLFAVALGLQEQSRVAVFRAFLPIALGHAASVALVVAVVGFGQTLISPGILKIVGASILVAFGLYKLLGRMSHPRWVGMRVGFRDLTAWSFLMASAHGAGLMLVPVLFNLPASGMSEAEAMQLQQMAHAEYMMMQGQTPLATLISQLTAVSIHTVAMFAVMGLVAIVVFEKVGLAILRRAWFNLDKAWAIVLIATGALTLVL
jgi:hypothetical protein